jgi:hypothetical protein
MAQIIVVKKSQIFDKAELAEIVGKCIALDLNLIVFGLPQSGKSSLIKAICRKSRKFHTLSEEESMEEVHDFELRQEHEGMKWAIGHQIPTMDEGISDEFLERFIVEKMGLNPKKWAIIRIMTK